MEFKVRGNVVLFDALEIKKASKLILDMKDKKYKLIVAYRGDEVAGIHIGNEIVLRNDNAKEIVELGGHIYWLTAPHNVLAIVEGNDVDTYTYEETTNRQKNSPLAGSGNDLILPHNQDIIMPNN